MLTGKEKYDKKRRSLTFYINRRNSDKRILNNDYTEIQQISKQIHITIEQAIPNQKTREYLERLKE